MSAFYNPGVLSAWERGAKLFNSGHYWEAHEQWEQGWLRLPRPEKDHVQGLIQICGALIHLERGNLGPSLKLAEAARKKLEAAEKSGQLEIFPRLEIAGAGTFLGALITGLKSEIHAAGPGVLNGETMAGVKEWLGRARELRCKLLEEAA